MKQFVFFLAIFGLGAATFALFDMFMAQKAEAPAETNPLATTSETVLEEALTEPEVPTLEEDKVMIKSDGTLLDGPFVLFSEDGEQTGASVRQIISPEERLLQFIDFNMEYSLASRVYLASDKEAREYLNLGPAKMQEDFLVYGIPLDADLSAFNYVLIYDEQRGETEYYARVK